MRVPALDDWGALTPSSAAALQRELRSQVVLEDALRFPEDVRVVAGVDSSYIRTPTGTLACAVAVALEFPSLEPVEERTAIVPVGFPYVPGLLSFREIPALLAALAKLEAHPDVVLVDAQGIAHPRRIGAASHLGLLLDGPPTVGCAKSKLVGQYEALGEEFGTTALLEHRGDVVGTVIRTRVGREPLYVSPGHRVSVETAARIALACTRPDTPTLMPEPTRLADALTRQLAAELKASQTGGSSPPST